MQKKTTGEVISRLGALTVMAQNLVPANHLEPLQRNLKIAEINEILSGGAGVPTEKIQVRSAERCAAGVWN